MPKYCKVLSSPEKLRNKNLKAKILAENIKFSNESIKDFKTLLKNALNAEEKSIREMTKGDFRKIMKKFGYLVSQMQAIEAFLEFEGPSGEGTKEANFDLLLKWIENNIFRIQKV